MNSHCVIFTDNPVTVPQVEEERVSVASTNVQFEDETAEKLDETLQLQYGEVQDKVINSLGFSNFFP